MIRNVAILEADIQNLIEKNFRPPLLKLNVARGKETLFKALVNNFMGEPNYDVI